jgi:hypothetical protein
VFEEFMDEFIPFEELLEGNELLDVLVFEALELLAEAAFELLEEVGFLKGVRPKINSEN